MDNSKIKCNKKKPKYQVKETLAEVSISPKFLLCHDENLNLQITIMNTRTRITPGQSQTRNRKAKGNDYCRKEKHKWHYAMNVVRSNNIPD